MTKKEQEVFERLWKRMVEGGIPLEERFELGVVRARVEKAFEAGVKFMKKTLQEKK